MLFWFNFMYQKKDEDKDSFLSNMKKINQMNE